MSDTDAIWTGLRRWWIEHAEQESSDRESWSSETIRQIYALTQKLMADEGWRGIEYCPKDGTVFLAWSPRVSMPYRCKYEGQWPTGRWWAMMDGDMWPDRPVLFKPFPAEKSPNRNG